MWYVYILETAYREYYVGSTNNLKRRIKEHISERDISTKWRLPVELEAYIAVKPETTARHLEKYLKTSSGKVTLRKRNLPDEASLLLRSSLRYSRKGRLTAERQESND